ncbi:response regulator [Listeria rocourtiae]|uniref:response regulator n=1 Tax=Listeria rocourtiae TaxID=647910 RepID=UPI0003E84C3B|nr:response regulator [Listeria rocourtiae]EUJ47024.1 LytTr DNA-binding domain protein [Listeria rocourtiae FSL F6-920]
MIDIDLNFYFNGIEIASILRNYNQQCFIIFVTGDPSKALSSINSGTLPTDYIIKEDFHSETVKEKIKNTISQIIQKQIQPALVKEIVYLNIGSNSEKVNISSINYISSIPNNRYSAALQTQNSHLIINTSLGKLKKTISHL